MFKKCSSDTQEWVTMVYPLAIQVKVVFWEKKVASAACKSKGGTNAFPWGNRPASECSRSVVYVFCHTQY